MYIEKLYYMHMVKYDSLYITDNDLWRMLHWIIKYNEWNFHRFLETCKFSIGTKLHTKFVTINITSYRISRWIL